MPVAPTLAVAIVVDLIAVTILAGPLYFRRHRRRDLMLSYVALNVGVLGVALALSGSQVGVGLGLGLFGVLSIVRLRSDQISQAEIAYYFTALALGLLAGIGAASIWMPALFAGLLLAVLYVVDHPRLLPAQRRRVVTLDRAYLDEHELRPALQDLLGGRVLRLEVVETDLVRDTTVVDVRYRMSRDACAAVAAAGDPVVARPAAGYPGQPEDGGRTSAAGYPGQPADGGRASAAQPVCLPAPFSMRPSWNGEDRAAAPTGPPQHGAGVSATARWRR